LALDVLEPLDQKLVDKLYGFRHDPIGYVKYAYEWNEGELLDSTGPRKWQAGILEDIGEHFSNPATRFTPYQAAVSSGHGIGKSALIAMVTNWAQSTRRGTKIVATANTKTQLDTKTVPEAHKWFRLGINSDWWEIKVTSISAKDEKEGKLWRADYIPWSENNTEAFAGLHNKGKRIVLIFDEASAISDRIWEVAEGALTDEDTEIIWLAFGNPTQNTGRFRECFGRFKHRWKTFQIDSRNVEGTNKAQIEKWIADYGEDSDFVRVRVRGEFPRAGSSQFIPSDIVAAARQYRADGFEQLPKILSCDVARFGDDQTVIGVRQGRHSRILAKYRGLDTVQVAERVIEFIGKEAPDATVIDADGIGAGVIDQIRFRGFARRLFEFHGGQSASDSAAYYNARAEVWGKLREWLVAGAEIPDDPELEADLTGPEYGFSAKQQIQLEKKEDMKKRGLSSPDCGDMLAMTFGVKVAAPTPPQKPEYRYPGQEGTTWME
jgi:hypothetical protein